jgi:uncharacterized protein YgiM (DUF1202 family)
MFSVLKRISRRAAVLPRVMLAGVLVLTFLNVSGWKSNAGAAAVDWSVGQQMVVATNALNSRAGPGLGYVVQRVLSNGTRLALTDGPVSANGYTWYEYDSWGVTGWVAGDYLAVWGSGSVLPLGSVVVSTARLNLRANAGLSAAVEAVLWKGDRMVVINQSVAADGYTWVRVNALDYGYGWVASEYAAPAGYKAIVPGVVIVVVDGPLNFRSTAGLSGTVLRALPEGTKAIVTQGPVSMDGYSWYRVFNSGYGNGWIAGAFIAIDPVGFVIED